VPTVSNGLSLCVIHHRAFDQKLVGVSPEYVVHVSRRLLEDEDGPMLDLLKAPTRCGSRSRGARRTVPTASASTLASPGSSGLLDKADKPWPP
jgi:hypothetical protein